VTPGLLLLCAALDGSAATYYIDFSSGSDTNSGTGASQAWKHCPGDASATGKANSTTPAAGDTVIFKGGVAYRGGIRLKGSGTAANPITYTGTGFGSGLAIMNGGDIFTTPWTNCASANDCYGNPNYANIWYTSIPSALTNQNDKSLDLIYVSNSICPFAQSPVPANPIDWARWWSGWSTVPPANMTSTNIIDTNVFTQSDPAFWTNAWLLFWVAGDGVVIIPVTNYVPASNMIQFYTSYTAGVFNGVSYYSILNNPNLIAVPGMTSVAPSQNRVYIWMPDSGNPNNETVEYADKVIPYSGGQIAFWNAGGLSNVVIDSFQIRGFANGVISASYGAAPSANITVQNCDISCGRGMNPHTFAIQFNASTTNSTGYTISNCVVHDSQVCGIQPSGTNVQVVSCIVSNISSQNYSAIYLLRVNNGLVSNCLVHGIYGVHCNGLTSYINGTNITFINNFVYDCPSVTCMSLQSTYNVNVLNNVMDGGNTTFSQVLSDFNGITGNFNILNNTLIGSSNNMALYLNSTNCATLVANNIIDGATTLPNITRYNNIYCGLLWSQMARYGWSLANGEIVSTNLGALFANPTAMDWRLATNSPAIVTGTNVAGVFPVLQTDIAGYARPARNQWPAGAHTPPPLTAPTGLHVLP